MLAITQAFAISGGPDYGGNVKVRTTGIYAGVMFPTSHVPCDTCDGQSQELNQLGLFSLPIPQTGLGSGTVLIFERGQIYTGTIQGTADPQSAQVHGIISASFPYLTTVPSGTDDMGNETFDTVTVIAQASGKLEAKIKAITSGLSTGIIRLKGTADIQFELTVNDPFDEIIFSVVGFKQAEL